jgi:hypothetical protein
MISNWVRSIALLALCGVPSLVHAQSIIICTAPSIGEVRVMLNSYEDFGHSLSCVDGSFIVDMAACAPAWGLGVTAGSGMSVLVAATTDRRVALGVYGNPILEHRLYGDELWFEGNYRDFDGKPDFSWRLVLDRVTGRATLDRKSHQQVTLPCSTVQPKF